LANYSISIYPLIVVIIIFMTIIGNSLVVIAVFSYRPLRKVQNYLLVSLAASDLCVATFVMPLHVVQFLAGGRWLLGMVICHFFTTADIFLCTSSILNLCAIALDRYWAIHDPLNYAQKRTLRFVCIIIAIVWLASGCISVPPLIGWNDWSGESLKTHCQLTTEKAFIIFSASGSFFVPLILMIIVYVKIFLAARQRIRTNRVLKEIVECGIILSLYQPATFLQKREKISVAKEKRAAKTIAVIIFVFSFCWLPFFSAYVILPFCETCSLHPKVQQAFVWLGYINSSLNPVLYGILNIEFRRGFKKILCSRSIPGH
uniref:G_PROTEIN_RECEP_F1_2 domain-containing protein n=1 Tax=Dracunculus medinensis TaxID=318479 RepID=A0A0N4UH41_DRAME